MRETLLDLRQHLSTQKQKLYWVIGSLLFIILCLVTYGSFSSTKHTTAGESCPPLRSLDLKLQCEFQGKAVSCDQPMIPGTTATPECKENYELAFNPGYSHLTCLSNGYWDYSLFYCTPKTEVAEKMYIPGEPWKPVTWDQAKENCAAKGYELATMKTPEQQFLFSEAVKKQSKDKSTIGVDIWIGLRASEGTGFVWVDGTVLGANKGEEPNWYSGQPYNQNGAQKFVLAANRRGSEVNWPHGKPYQWNDARCDDLSFYFCEVINFSGSLRKKYIPGTPWRKVHWKEARDNCQSKGTQLATIKNQEERELFIEAVESAFRNSGVRKSNIWIGLRKALVFNWVDGSVPNFTNWLTDEPKDLVWSECTAAVADVLPESVHEKAYQWSENECSSKNYYFCSSNTNEENNSEKKYIPGEPWIKLTWEEARENCEAQGHELAVITSQDEQESFKKVAEKQFIETGTAQNNIWIGLESGRRLTWIDGSVLTENEEFWMPGEPNHAYYLEGCVEAVVGDDHTYEWMLGERYRQLYYFCSSDKQS